MARDPNPRREEIAPIVTNSFVVCLVDLVYPVSLGQPNKRDKLNKPDEPEKPAGSHASRVSGAPVIYLQLLVTDGGGRRAICEEKLPSPSFLQARRPAPISQ